MWLILSATCNPIVVECELCFVDANLLVTSQMHSAVRKLHALIRYIHTFARVALSNSLHCELFIIVCVHVLYTVHYIDASRFIVITTNTRMNKLASSQNQMNAIFTCLTQCSTYWMNVLCLQIWKEVYHFNPSTNDRLTATLMNTALKYVLFGTCELINV